MFEIQSQITGMEMPMHSLTRKLEPLGFHIGENVEYGHGYMDYKMVDNGGDQFLRIPFSASIGEIGSGNATVVIGTPFLATPRYGSGGEEDGITFYSALFSQFSTSEDKDVYIDPVSIREGMMLAREIEHILT